MDYLFLDRYLDRIIAGEGHQNIRIRFSLMIGVPNRDFINAIKNYAFIHNTICIINEDKGWLESYYRIELSGELYKVFNISAYVYNMVDDGHRPLDEIKIRQASQVLLGVIT